MAYSVFPRENGVLAEAAFTEQKWALMFGDYLRTDVALTMGINFVKSGYTYSSGAGLVATFATGSAIVGGYFVQLSGADLDITLPASSTSYVYIKVLTDPTNRYATGAQLVSTTSTAPPAVKRHHVLLAKIVTGVSTISSTADLRPTDPRRLTGTYTGTGAGSGSPHTIVMGFRPSLVIVSNETVGNIHLSHGIATYGVRIVAAGTATIANTGNIVPSIQDFGFQVYGSSGSEFLDHTGSTYKWLAIP